MLASELHEQNEKLFEQLKHIGDLKEQLQESLHTTKALEIKTAGDVEDDSKKEDWKIALSNATKRSVEVTSRLGRNEVYQNHNKRIEMLKKDIDNAELKYKFDSKKLSIMMLEYERITALTRNKIGNGN